jgi:hypothetical protein
LILRKKIDQRLNAKKNRIEWLDIKQDLKALKQIEIEEEGKHFASVVNQGGLRKIFQSVHIALPPTIKELN